jgi:hypothetical protein
MQSLGSSYVLMNLVFISAFPGLNAAEDNVISLSSLQKKLNKVEAILDLLNSIRQYWQWIQEFQWSCKYHKCIVYNMEKN